MSGAEMIAAERRRQVEAEGWTPEHDDGHVFGDLAASAVSYATYAVAQVAACLLSKSDADELMSLADEQAMKSWAWDRESWKPGDAVRNLVKAGALIAAEIDRIQRQQMKERNHEG